jgi:hypothetical protein
MSKHRVARLSLKDADLEPLVRATLAGDRRARQDLWLAVDPAIETIAGRCRFLSRPHERDDASRDVVLLVMDRLWADGYRRLALLHEVLLRREEAGLPWLSAVTRRLAHNYLEGHAENVGGREQAWVDVVPLREELEEQLPESVRAEQTVDAHRIRAYAERTLSAPELLALRLWCEGADRREIAGELGLASEHDAHTLVRAVIQRLRRGFGRQ